MGGYGCCDVREWCQLLFSSGKSLSHLSDKIPLEGIYDELRFYWEDLCVGNEWEFRESLSLQLLFFRFFQLTIQLNFGQHQLELRGSTNIGNFFNKYCKCIFPSLGFS